MRLFVVSGEPLEAGLVARGVSRLMLERGYSPLLEFTLPSGRRLDVAAVSDSGEIVAVEIKVSLADLRADEKWVEYLEYCDRFYFAVPEDFPQEALPAEHGLIVADRFGAAVIRDSERATVSGARRKALLIRFARCAAERLTRAADPFAP
ncbi:MAG: MmcB family DNA repair protein [Alphaproteobacteria bacterium]|nr:MmcB family DNA repair protein [Alphaproteobacteria bacterium]